jgi:hypothetical protein
MIKLPFLQRLINDGGTKVYLYFATKMAGDNFDPYEKNYVDVNLNPNVIKGYMTTISPEALVWTQYGLNEIGSVELFCETKYTSWFKQAKRIVIEGNDYSVFTAGGRLMIQDRPYGVIRVILQKKGA